MIVTESAGSYRLVTQPAHSQQAGRLARHWGNDRFDAPDPHHACTVATAIHDNGWWGYDLRPRLVEGAPADVLDPAKAEWAGFYERGPERAASVDPYAGLLVSLHGTGVRRQRYGWDRSIPDRSGTYGEFIERQERFQRGLFDRVADDDRYAHLASPGERAALDAMHETGTVDLDGEENPPQLWRNYRLLQVWDRLSLALCWNDPLEATTLGPVPVGGESPVTIDLEPLGDGRLRLDPYPFDTDQLTAPVEGRTVPATVGSERALVEAYYRADPERFEFELIG
jgi:hypothetical protein